ncbi:RDD family protein [Paenibacillus sp. F4]|uniref:RDD family protein n=1 Tax=Paenibacillus sp. F4 TaxID=357385 RepID=UPI000C9F4F0D|nr:RDD family protein [Paenibacillus sp. F4]PNQ82152.1 RDD family protein [Paenibacillus sp. F4]
MDEQHISHIPQETSRQTYIRHGQNYGVDPNRMAALSKTYGNSTLFRRWGATVFDCIFFVIGYICFFISVIQITDRWFLPLAIATRCILLIAFFSYYLLLEGYTGYTLGKFVFRIKVVNGEGRPPGFLKSLIRTLLRLIDTNPLLMGGIPAGISVLVTASRQRIGDLAAGTYVVKVRDLEPISKKTMKRSLFIFFTAMVILGASFVNAIFILADSYVPPEAPVSKKEQSYVSKDGRFQISAPLDWSTDPDREKITDIAIFNPYIQKSVAVVSNSKKELGNVTLQHYTKKIQYNMTKEFNLSTVGPSSNTTIHGYPAIEFTIKGQKDVNHYVTHVAIIETEKDYYQVLGYAPASKDGRLKQELHDIIYSFREVRH